MQCNAQTSNATEVAPGITLPTGGDGTVYALDTGSNGPVLLHIQPHEVVSASHAATNFLRAQVYAGPHSSTEVDGPHAPIALASTKAIFFVRITGEDAEIMRSRVHLLWLQPNKKRRQISDFSRNIFGGQHTRNVDEVPCAMDMIEGTNWLKVTPNDPLLPGEFAVAFLPKDVNQYPEVVYDFSVPGDKPSANNPYEPKPPANSDTTKH
ncbi:MAG: hypothetical protein ACLQM6_12950 [Acidobacteriaceae bacterium]